MKPTDRIFDGLLVLRYRSGDKEAFNLLVKRHHFLLCKHAYWYTKDLDVAKDIVQDCWSLILLRIPSLRDPNGFKAWATKIVGRKALDYIKRNKKNSEQLKQYNAISATSEVAENKSEETRRLQKAIEKLPEDQQIVLRLFYMQEYSLNEIADILGIAAGTVKSRLFHAREKLKRSIKT